MIEVLLLLGVFASSICFYMAISQHQRQRNYRRNEEQHKLNEILKRQAMTPGGTPDGEIPPDPDLLEKERKFWEREANKVRSRYVKRAKSK